jgi:LmbE family N-acetylglucosaminyl deacetylase
MTRDQPGHRPTLMTVHAHPDDESIGTGGTMAKAVAAGHRVVLVTGTRGEMGEIVWASCARRSSNGPWPSSG